MMILTGLVAKAVTSKGGSPGAESWRKNKVSTFTQIRL